MRIKIRLDTYNDVKEFVEISNRIDSIIYLEDGNGLRVNAKSLLGALYTMEYNDIYCVCADDISNKIFTCDNSKFNKLIIIVVSLKYVTSLLPIILLINSYHLKG